MTRNYTNQENQTKKHHDVIHRTTSHAKAKSSRKSSKKNKGILVRGFFVTSPVTFEAQGS